MYVTRNSEPMIREVSKSFPCIVLYGPRQVGKSTTIDHIFGDAYIWRRFPEGDAGRFGGPQSCDPKS